MVNRITRRGLAGAIAASAATLAQAPAGIPGTPDEELEAAREQNRRNAQALRKVPLPMATEPAFQFTA